LAKSALRRFRRNGAALDPNNELHVSAYMMCRRLHERPTPQQVLTAIASRNEHHAQGMGMEQDAWLVPKANFPSGELPQWIIDEGLLTEEEVQAQWTIQGEPVDFANNWVVDSCIKRSALGKFVKRIFMFQKMTTNMVVAEHRERQEDSGQEDSPQRPRRTTRRHTSAESAASDRAAPAPRAAPALGDALPPTARETLLAERDAEVVVDPEAQEMLQLTTNIKAAARAGNWHSPDPSVAGTVSFWVAQAINSLPDAPAAPAPKAAEAPAEVTESTQDMLREGICGYLEKLAMRSPCYEHIHMLVELFDKLLAKGCARPELLDGLRALSKHDLLDSAVVELKGVPLLKVMGFFASALYLDFEGYRAVALLGAARKAATAEERQRRLTAALAACKNLKGEESAVVGDVAKAHSMFSDEVPLLDRIKFALEDDKHREARLAFADDWAGDTTNAAPEKEEDGKLKEMQVVPWAAIRYFGAPADSLTQVSFECFLFGGALVHQTGIWSKQLPNKTACAAWELAAKMRAACGGCSCAPKVEIIVQAALGERTKNIFWDTGLDANKAAAEFPACHLELLTCALTKYFLHSHKREKQWLTSLREQQVAAEERAAEAKKKAREDMGDASEEEPPSSAASRARPRAAPALGTLELMHSVDDIVYVRGRGQTKLLQGSRGRVTHADKRRCTVVLETGPSKGETRLFTHASLFCEPAGAASGAAASAPSEKRKAAATAPDDAPVQPAKVQKKLSANVFKGQLFNQSDEGEEGNSAHAAGSAE